MNVLYMEEVKKERYFKEVRENKKRIAERKQIIKSIKILTIALICLLVYIWRLI